MNLEAIESRFPIDQFWLFLADSMWPILPNANNEEELYVKKQKKMDGYVWCFWQLCIFMVCLFVFRYFSADLCHG